MADACKIETVILLVITYVLHISYSQKSGGFLHVVTSRICPMHVGKCILETQAKRSSCMCFVERFHL